MRSNNALLGVSVVLFIALVGAIVYAFGGRPVQDGNPIGYDVTGTPTGATPAASSRAGCLESHSCKSIAIHYVRTPPGHCPSPVPTELASQNLCTSAAQPVRTLPSCPPTAQCITFVSKPNAGELNVMTQDDDGFHPYSKTDGEAIIILQP